MASPSSSCELYSVPTWLLKESLPVFLPSLPSISRIRRYLDQDSAKTIVHAYAISRLDYANSLLYNINSNLLHRPQIVQNTAARIILKAIPHDHVTPLLYSLHCLPIDKRILFECLVMIHKCINRRASKYLSELMVMRCPTRDLTSGSQCFYMCPKKKKFGDQAFVNFAPQLWKKFTIVTPLHLFICHFKENS